MIVNVLYRNKPAVLEFNESDDALALRSRWGFRVYFNVRATPSLQPFSLDGTVLRCSTFVMDVDPDPANLANAARVVATAGGAPVDPLVALTAERAKPSVREEARERSYRIAAAVEGLTILLAVVGAIGGVVLALQTEELCSSEYSCSTTHPYVGAGVGIAVASVFQCAVVIMIAAYIQYRSSPAAGPA